ncbi:hypothetical protein [Yokenella regensburgei]|uniref:hypothetical protein n=1 Tax=Yokenella regensburgei TaxID=158877 RepID=UPI001ED91BF0|nr:hypothetical protein [Yokenella regensburgei]KAF1366287.1 hypothetical protein FHR25_005255 [Yokenella regensburgei]
MIWLEKGLYVRIEEMANGSKPLPLQSGFNTQIAYRILGCYNASESSDAFFIFSNDRDEMWFICNRHVRIVGLYSDRLDVRLDLKSLTSN